MVKYQKVEIYDCTVVFLINPTKVEFEIMYHDNVSRVTDAEYREMYKDIFDNDKCGGFTRQLECGDVVCCVKEPYNEGYIAHEILHTTNRILLSRGIVADFENDEPQTYLDGWLTTKYYECLSEMTKELEKKK